jgi:hypothetical protein
MQSEIKGNDIIIFINYQYIGILNKELGDLFNAT